MGGQRQIDESLIPRRTYHCAGQEAALRLLGLADYVRAFYERVLAPHGVTTQQYNVLRILRGAGPAGLPTLQIGERMIEKSPGVTRLLDRLEKKGWVGRGRGTEDRRQVIAHLTPLGRQLLSELDDPVVAADHEVFGLMATESLDAMVGSLREAEHAVLDWPSEDPP